MMRKRASAPGLIRGRGTRAGRSHPTAPEQANRSTKAEVEHRRAALVDLVAAMRPITVRQVFYQASVRSMVEKSEASYAKVQTDLALMRRVGEMP
jgi:hypothetical protein